MLTRRTLMKGALVAGAYAGGVGLAGRFGGLAKAEAPVTLVARPGEAMITDKGPTKGVMTYGDAEIPPVLRMRRGEAFALRLDNRLDEPTTIHWHGLRIDNRMDGVPFLTQPYVYGGDGFDYAFTPPDAGTFWYHPHCNTLTQIGRGLAGLVVVEDPADPVFDAEIVLNLRDWRLGGDGQFIAQFKPRDAARAGTFGTVRTANWRQSPQYDAPAGGLVRLRLAATDVTRILALQMEGAEATVIALDGNPAAERFALDHLMIGPGQRLDLVLRMPDTEGAVAALKDLRGTKPATLATFRATGASLKRDARDLPPLTQNPLPEPDLSAATEIPFVLSASAEERPKDGICGSLGYNFWAINKVPWADDTGDPTAPLAEMKAGKTYIFNVENPTPQVHPLHLHGLVFRPMNSNKQAIRPHFSDTYLILPDEKVQLALVADNPGDWVFHCHIIEHQKTGMTSYVRVV
ncbi:MULTISPECIES: multicopper oxidase family protein [unclassified Shinella]|uniref:multicopper oxidase family protein n=1 Tax=unclassified Shinella TaxID=2643062 RepID=UPI00225CF9EC|nr:MULTISPECIES: multicopper oxidase family protein [unclassified Shinella]MCO5141432.1 multicopper oxidase family protein [Shinella sp.]MDC7254045.1 multicopper oxidase family protein [Shinella sp. YE25]CAI0336708.1 Multicopper oxidase [Rhizobiaceae bacterium]CAK7255240.1 multicopper oxidase [Shinella sp. WSC3-e]